MDIEIKVSYGDRVATLEVSQPDVMADDKISVGRLDRFLISTFAQCRAMIIAGERGDIEK